MRISRTIINLIKLIDKEYNYFLNNCGSTFSKKKKKKKKCSQTGNLKLQSRTKYLEQNREIQ